MHHSLWTYFMQASFVVKFVMLVLIAASVVSWVFIIQRGQLLKQVKDSSERFRDKFFSGMDLQLLFGQLKQSKDAPVGNANLFQAGFNEFLSCDVHEGEPIPLERIERSLWIAQNHEMRRLESQMSFLATVGSVSPYVGLFGTVWGIMHSFSMLGEASQATIAMVAPGIAEALVATAMGLFAAIPAVIAYNRYTVMLDNLQKSFATFSQEFLAVLNRHGDEQ